MLYKTSHAQIIDGLMSNSLKKIPINWVLSFVRTTSVIHLMLRLTRKILYGLSRSKQMPKSFSSVRMALSSLPTLCFLVAEPLFSLWRNPVVIHRCHKQNSKMLKFLPLFFFSIKLTFKRGDLANFAGSSGTIDRTCISGLLFVDSSSALTMDCGETTRLNGL